MEQRPSTRRPRRYTQSGAELAIGIGAGVALGAAFGNLAMGIAIGTGMGVALGEIMARRNRSE